MIWESLYPILGQIRPHGLILLYGNFDGFEATLKNVRTLVGLAARMADSKDELLVLGLLRIDATGFVKQVEFYRHRLNLTVSKSTCSRDGATIAKSQEMLRLYSDAASLVQSIIKKIGPSPPQ